MMRDERSYANRGELRPMRCELPHHLTGVEIPLLQETRMSTGERLCLYQRPTYYSIAIPASAEVAHLVVLQGKA